MQHRVAISYRPDIMHVNDVLAGENFYRVHYAMFGKRMRRFYIFGRRCGLCSDGSVARKRL
eukprot:305299-Pleurochrysis_carterae.AAC.3